MWSLSKRIILCCLVFALSALACNVLESESEPDAPAATSLGGASDSDAQVSAATSEVILYEQSSENSPALAVLAVDTPLKILQRTADNRWLQVRTPDSREGWVASTQLNIFVDLRNVPIEGQQTDLTPVVVQNQTQEGNDDDILGASRAHLAEIYLLGQTLGNRANVFVKVGDSITESNYFLSPFGEGTYDLAQYTHLQEAVTFFSQAEMYEQRNPFNAISQAAKRNWTSASVLDNSQANPRYCYPGEAPLACEYASVRPAIALVMLGTNDVSIMSSAEFKENMSNLVELSLEKGVIPVLSTIPDRRGYERQVQAFNEVIKELAAIYDIPLWDYAGAMAILPDKGLSADGAHPSTPRGEVATVADFSPENLQYGYTIRNLMALEILDRLRRDVILASQ